jgi:hypothetical protein
MEGTAIEQLQPANKPDGTFVQQLDKQVFIVDIFFNHNSKETLEDKFLRVILAEERKLQLQNGGIH